MKSSSLSKIELGVEHLIFMSRWLQAPMYVGLIASCVLYCYKFMIELWHLWTRIGTISENDLLLSVLGLVDVTMVANLIVMVIIGGYSTFVSKLNIETSPDRPGWLNHITASTLKIKLVTALATISGVHLLKSFIDVDKEIRDGCDLIHQGIFWQVIIHSVFLISALLLAWTDRLGHVSDHSSHGNNHSKEALED